MRTRQNAAQQTTVLFYEPSTDGRLIPIAATPVCHAENGDPVLWHLDELAFFVPHLTTAAGSSIRVRSEAV